MKSTVLVSLILAVSSIAHAADAGQTRKSNGGAANSKKETFAYATAPFDPTSEKLPANYRGHNILDIIKKLSPPRTKGEFEKTEEYETRVTRWKETAFHGKVTPTDLLAFEVSEHLAPDGLSVEYDADVEEITATVSFKNHYFDSVKARWLETFYHSKNLGSHIGTTRMGVKFRVTSHLGTSVGLAVKENIKPISITKSMSRDEALLVKSSISAYAIANFTEPYKIDDSRLSTASLDKPSEWLTKYWGLWVDLKAIWFVNRRTGEVIAKVETPFPQCKYDIC